MLSLLSVARAWNTVSRRAVLTKAASVTLATPLAVSADEVTDLLYGAKSLEATVFAGTYTDPIHPGGTRTITLDGTRLGPYQLAKISGGGGEGEPAQYELPAMVSRSCHGNQCIVRVVLAVRMCQRSISSLLWRVALAMDSVCASHVCPDARAQISPAPGQKGTWQITIDFSPKGGPKDFTGYWDADGIKFPPTPRQIERGNTAGNKWPKIS